MKRVLPTLVGLLLLSQTTMALNCPTVELECKLAGKVRGQFQLLQEKKADLAVDWTNDEGEKISNPNRCHAAVSFEYTRHIDDNPQGPVTLFAAVEYDTELESIIPPLRLKLAVLKSGGAFHPSFVTEGTLNQVSQLEYENRRLYCALRPAK